MILFSSLFLLDQITYTFFFNKSHRGIALLQGGQIGVIEQLLDASDPNGLVSETSLASGKCLFDMRTKVKLGR